MKSNFFLPPCPLKKNWKIFDVAFDPQLLWNSQNMQLIKEAKRRKVFFCKGYYIKAFKSGYNTFFPFRDLAKKEWKIAARLHIGHHTAPPAAYGKNDRWSYFVTSEIKGPDLESFLGHEWPYLTRTQKKKVIRLFVRFICGISESGVFQPDFHLKNIIFDKYKERFVLLDLHRAKLVNRSLHSDERMDQLTYVLPPMWEKLRQRELIEFTSLLSRIWPELKSRKQRYWIQERAFTRMREHWDKKGIKWILNKTVKSSYGKFIVLRSKQCPDYILGMLISFVKHPEKFQTTGNILKNSRHTLCLKIVNGSTKYFLKAYRSSGHLKSLSYVFKKPRIMRAWHISQNFLLRNVSIPFPLVAIHTGNPWKSIYGAMISSWIKAGDQNTILIKKTLQQDRYGVLIKNLAYFLWQMHEKGFFHGDCKITNFYFDPVNKHRFTVFDFDSVRIKKAVNDKDRISDIADICASIELWKIRKYITRDFLLQYIRLRIPWEKESSVLLEKLDQKVEARLKRKRHAR
jgi:tRNA A-37 threonylcarbamoyl transferase component Bud32